ncbi:MAG: response regulator [Scytonematopsis contorta HA4267-MV1]|jgi:signal transduction histidine kinase|nr:response regulator [Scytonematopsis contorta HA4267-MV1]
MLKVLIVDDDEVDRMAVRRSLNTSDMNITLLEASDYLEAMDFLEDTSFDCVFLDYRLPGKDGLALIQEIRATGNKVPLVVLTGQGDEQIAVELMKAGASDYITKSRINSELLSKTIKNVVRIYKAESQIELFNKQLIETNEQLKRKNEELEEKQRQIHLQNIKLLEAAELKSKFLATMSHELRTPLNAIMAFSQMLIRKTKEKLSASEADMLERVYNNGKNLLALINDILDLSKIEAGGLQLSPEEFDIAQLVKMTTDELRALAEQKQISLNIFLNIQSYKIINDRTRVRQVLVNLISNAIKFTETGGVTIQINEIYPDRLVIAVKDTGIGIASEDLRHIFEPFRQINQSNSRPYQGTGLGLAITDSLVKMMNGCIYVKSELGNGSEFSFELPRSL